MSYIYQPNGTVWYIQICQNGVYKRKSLRTKDKATAKRLQVMYDAKLHGVKTGSIKGRVRVDVMIEDYVKLKQGSLKPRSLIRYLELTRTIGGRLAAYQITWVDQLDSGAAARYLDDRLAAGASPKTIDDEMVLLKSMLKWLLSEGMIAESPVRQWPKIKTIPRAPQTLGAYSVPEVKLLKEYFRFREFGDFFLFALYTGARRDEGVCATVGDFDASTGRLRLRNGKSETSGEDTWRHLSVHPELLPVIQRRAAGRSFGDLLFPEMQNHSRNWCQSEMIKACKACKVQYKRFHGLRHTFVTHLIAGGVDIRQVMGAAGHSKIETTQRYAHLAQEIADVGKLTY